MVRALLAILINDPVTAHFATWEYAVGGGPVFVCLCGDPDADCVAFALDGRQVGKALCSRQRVYKIVPAVHPKYKAVRRFYILFVEYQVYNTCPGCKANCLPLNVGQCLAKQFLPIREDRGTGPTEKPPTTAIYTGRVFLLTVFYLFYFYCAFLTCWSLMINSIICLACLKNISLSIEYNSPSSISSNTSKCQFSK